MKYFRIPALGMAAACALAFTIGAAAAEDKWDSQPWIEGRPITLKAGYNTVKQYPHARAIERFVNRVAERTGENFQIQTFPSEQAGMVFQPCRTVRPGLCAIFPANKSPAAFPLRLILYSVAKRHVTLSFRHSGNSFCKSHYWTSSREVVIMIGSQQHRAFSTAHFWVSWLASAGCLTLRQRRSFIKRRGIHPRILYRPMR